MSASPAAVVFDHTALMAFGAGHRLLSGLVVAAHQESGRVFVPALCLAAASAERPALGEHVGALPAVEVVDLGYASALAVGRLVRGGLDWRVAHAAAVGRPDPEWPTGRPVLTEVPDAYANLGVTTIRLP